MPRCHNTTSAIIASASVCPGSPAFFLLEMNEPTTQVDTKDLLEETEKIPAEPAHRVRALRRGCIHKLA